MSSPALANPHGNGGAGRKRFPSVNALSEFSHTQGRHLSAWLGIVPENDSTGGKVKQKGLSKKGDRYLRSLLITGAMAVVRQAKIRPDKHPWVTKLLGRMSKKQAAVAIANKTARIAWAIMVHGGVYDAAHRAPQCRAEACAATK